METLFTYDGLYNDINQTFSEAKDYCNEINALRNNINSSIIEGEKLTNETRGFILDFQNNVQVGIDGIDRIVFCSNVSIRRLVISNFYSLSHTL